MRSRAGIVWVLGVTVIAATKASAQDSPAPVCVGADRVLRKSSTPQCPYGQAAYLLLGDEGNEPPSPAKMQAAMRDLQARIARLTADLNRLEQTAATRGSTVRAPFQVVDKAGKAILLVEEEPRSLRVQDPAGHPLAIATALPTGGFFKALTPSENRVAVLGASNNMALVTVRDGPDTPRATLAVTADGNTALVIMNKQHQNVATLSHKESGMLQLSNPTGQLRLEAGVTQTDLGAVYVGPGSACVGGDLVLPPSCLRGRRAR